jgi:signal transduction histidine kinase/CheY-like chemotaxis protein
VNEINPVEEGFLVLAPTGRDGALTQALLEKAGLCCMVCTTLSELCERFERDGAAALLIAKEVFASDGLARLGDLLARQASWSDIPVLIFTGKATGIAARPTTAQLLSSIGNVTLLDRPLRPVTMLSAARTALRARRRQYAARAELNAQRVAVRERDQFLAMLGHELRNPLSTIAMALHLDDDGKPSRYRAILRRQTEHLTRLVDDLLDVSRVTSGKIVLRRQNVELSSLTRNVLQMLAPTLNGALEIVQPDAAGPNVWVDADPARLQQVLTNLIQNAIKYTAADGKIEVTVAAEADCAVLRVRDSGVGLAPEMIERVFDLFTQVEHTLDRAKGGMGIGLTLVRSLVRLHGGTVAAESGGLGKGSVFTVTLPRIAHEDDVAPVTERLERTSDIQPTAAGSYDVLVVEDNEDSRELLAALLKKRGYRVFTADDGLSGVEQALEHTPRVLLVDIGLPGLDGYGVARRVRAQLGDRVYMVALTGYGQPEDRKRALAAGFNLHLVKPIDVDTLDDVLAREYLRAVV